jgi:hypothetical protein
LVFGARGGRARVHRRNQRLDVALFLSRKARPHRRRRAAGFARAIERDLEQHRSEQLVERDRRDAERFEALEEREGLLDQHDEPQRETGLRDEAREAPALHHRLVAGHAAREAAGRQRDEGAAAGEQQRHGPHLLHERKIEVRARDREEQDEHDAARSLDRVEEHWPLIRQVLHDEPGDHEHEQGVERQVANDLVGAHAEQQEHEDQLPADEADVRREYEPERRPDRDAAHQLVAEALEIVHRERGRGVDQRLSDEQAPGECDDDDDVARHDERQRERGDGALRAGLREDAERGRRAARDRDAAPHHGDASRRPQRVTGEEGQEGSRQEEHDRHADQAERRVQQRRPGQALRGAPQHLHSKLGAAGEGDERQRERVHEREIFDRRVIDQVQHVGTGNGPREDVAREVRQLDDLDQLARQGAGQE